MIELGKHTYGFTNFKLVGGTKGEITFGKYCSLGDSIMAFMSHDHDSRSISSYPFNHHQITRKLEINVGNDVFIGSNAVLFRDITIGDGAFIGAYATITKDVPPYTIVVGHNQVVRKRFSDEDIAFLLKLKWWDMEDDEVAKIAPILISSDIKKLRELYQ